MPPLKIKLPPVGRTPHVGNHCPKTFAHHCLTIILAAYMAALACGMYLGALSFSPVLTFQKLTPVNFSTSVTFACCHGKTMEPLESSASGSLVSSDQMSFAPVEEQISKLEAVVSSNLFSTPDTNPSLAAVNLTVRFSFKVRIHGK